MTASPSVLRPSTEDQIWDGTVAALSAGTVYQTSMWAQVKGSRTRVRRVESTTPTDAGTTRSVAQLLIRRLGPLATAAYVPYGPLHEAQPVTIAEVRPIVEAIEVQARAAGCAVVLVQPARSDQVTAAALRHLGYGPAPVDVATSATLEVELGVSDEELFSRLSKSRRRNVRRARSSGVTVRTGGRADLSTLVRLYTASAQRQGFLPMSLPYLLRQWDILHPSGHMELLLAVMDGRTVAAGTMIGFGGLAEFKLTGWDGSDQARTANANELLNWVMMSRANAAGYWVFDLGGLPRDLAVRAGDVGVVAAVRGTGSEFKHGWGGELAIHPRTVQKILRPIGHISYGLPAQLLADDGWGGRIVNWVRRT